MNKSTNANQNIKCPNCNVTLKVMRHSQERYCWKCDAWHPLIEQKPTKGESK